MSTSEYIAQPGDSLPSIAEACGHPGEWQLIAQWNADNPHMTDYNNIQPGMTIILPDLTSWPAPDAEATTETRSSSKVADAAAAAEHLERRGSSKSSD